VKSIQAAGLVASVLALGLAPGCKQLDTRPNVGPCPVAATLYDASRVVELKGIARHENVGFTGSVEGIRAFCRYVGKDPIEMEIEISFAFGKGPKADGNSHAYPYFVAVTRRDRSILAKDVHSVNVQFPAGAARVDIKEKVEGIIIPRATETISGTNFEVLVGFDLTAEQLAYNRSGQRFTFNVDNGKAPAPAASPSPAPAAPPAAAQPAPK
jgi:hypothetical protein